MNVINKDELLEFPYLPESGTDEIIMDLAWKTMPKDIVIDNDQNILDFGWEIVKAMLNVIKTAETFEYNGIKND